MSVDNSGSLAERVLTDARILGLSVKDLGLAVARSLGVVALTLVVYAVLPVRTASSAAGIILAAVAGMVVVGLVFIRQLGRISKANSPALAGVEALALVFGIFITMQALIYVGLSTRDAGSFTEPLDKMDGLYFAVTVLTTVGFGDITATTALARGVVTFQMVVNLALIGTAVKVLSTSTRRAARARRTQGRAGPAADERPEPRQRRRKRA